MQLLFPNEIANVFIWGWGGGKNIVYGRFVTSIQVPLLASEPPQYMGFPSLVGHSLCALEALLWKYAQSFEHSLTYRGKQQLPQTVMAYVYEIHISKRSENWRMFCLEGRETTVENTLQMLRSGQRLGDGSDNVKHNVDSFSLEHITALWEAVLPVPLDPTGWHVLPL